MTAESELVRASLLAGMTDSVPVHRIHLYFVALHDQHGSRSIESMQRTLQSGGDHGIWSGGGPDGDGWWSFTKAGYQAAKREYPRVRALYPPLTKEQIRFHIGSADLPQRVELHWLGGHRFETLVDGERVVAKEACPAIAKMAKRPVPPENQRAPRFIWRIAVEDGWSATWQGPYVPPPPPPPPPNPPLTAKEKKAVELRAMDAAKVYFLGEGWADPDDTSKHHPYDWMFRRGEDELRVEVKGTTGPGASVSVTAGEVEAARAHLSALFVLHSIQLERGAKPKATGGVPHVLMPWKPDEQGTLVATQYRYGVPGLDKK